MPQIGKSKPGPTPVTSPKDKAPEKVPAPKPNATPEQDLIGNVGVLTGMDSMTTTAGGMMDDLLAQLPGEGGQGTGAPTAPPIGIPGGGGGGIPIPTPFPNTGSSSTGGGGASPNVIIDPNSTPSQNTGGGGGGASPNTNIDPNSTPSQNTGGGGGGASPNTNIDPNSTPSQNTGGGGGGGGGGGQTPAQQTGGGGGGGQTPAQQTGGGGGGGGQTEPQQHEPPEPDEGTDNNTNDAVDDFLDDNYSNDQASTTQNRARDWIDTVNDIRGHPLGEAVINTGERLIPFYGFYDGVRDSWNSLSEQWEQLDSDWFMKTILVAQMVVSVVGNLASHLDYLVHILGYFAYLLEGAGAVANAISSETLGNIAIACDVINAVLGIIGAAWAAYQARNAEDPQTRARYQWLTFKQVEHTFSSAASALVGYLLTKATVDQVPAVLGRGIGKAAAEGLTGGLAAGAAKLLVGGATEGTGFSTQAPPPVNPTGRLPKDIFGDIASVGYLFTDEGTPAREKVDRFVRGGPRVPPAPPPNATETAPIVNSALDENTAMAQRNEGGLTASIPTPVDHAPRGVSALAETESQLTAALAASNENVQVSTERVTNLGAMQGHLAEAQGVAANMTGAASTAQNDLLGAIPVGQELVSQITQVTGGFQQMAGPMGNLGGAVGQARNHGNYRPRAREGRSLLQRAMDWLIERAMNSVLGAAGQVSGSAGTASGKQSEGRSEVAGATGRSQQTQSEEQQSLSETQAAAGEAAGGVASSQSTQDELTQAGTELTQRQGEAQEELTTHTDERGQIQSLLEEVTAEKERQESENQAFRDQYGEQFPQEGEEQRPPITEVLIGGLREAYDTLEAMGDDLLSEGGSLLGNLGDLLDPGQQTLDTFRVGHETRMAVLMGLLNDASGLVGQSGEDAWRIVSELSASIVGAETELLASWSETLATLNGMMQMMQSLMAQQQQMATQAIGSIR